MPHDTPFTGPWPSRSDAPFVTVVTPTLNSAATVAETMRTVALQRAGGNVRVEHLVLDGGSTDDTAKIVAEWQHPDTHFIVRKDDKGPADAINAGLDLAHGEFLCWLNSDDVYAPYALERATAVLRRHPKAAFCFGRCRIINRHGQEIRRFVTRFKNCFFPLSCHFLIRTLNYISQPAMVFRASAFRQAGPLRTDLKAAWDYDLTLRLWHQGRPVAVPAPELAYFRWTPGSISGSHYERQFREELDAAIADTGRPSVAIFIHHLLAHSIVFLYKRVCSRNPEPVSEERIDRQPPEAFAQAQSNEARDSTLSD